MKKNLINLKVNQVGEVFNFDGNLETNSRIFSLGIIKGKKLKVIEKTQSHVIISCGSGTIALDKSLIKGIEVTLCH